MADSIKVSIIIPVYNVGEFLEQCINSIRSQNYSNWEMICINDCSTDNSLEILNSYAQKDERIRVITLPYNQGQGAARNLGLELAEGEYILFVDPDDWIAEGMFERLSSLLIEYEKPEILQFDFIHYNNFTKKTRKNNLAEKFKHRFNYDLNKYHEYSIDNCKRNFFTKILPACWNKIYLASFLKENNIKFTTDRFGEDCAFTFIALIKAKKIKYINEYFYYYRYKDTAADIKITPSNFKSFEYLNVLNKFLIESKCDKCMLKDFERFKINEIHYNYIKEYKDEYFEHVKKYLSQKEYGILVNKIKRDELIKKIFYIEKTKVAGKRAFNIYLFGKEFSKRKSK